MTGELYIDGIDVGAAYGISLSENGLCGVMQIPPSKSVDYNDWPDEDGIEPDLEHLYMDANVFDIALNATGVCDIEGFTSLLSDGAYHTWYFAKIDVTKELRVTSQSGLSMLRNLGNFALRVSEDSPVDDSYTYVAPQSNYSGRQSGYSLDGVALDSYGIYVKPESIIEIKKMPEVKNNLMVKVSNKHGVEYDEQNVVFRSKDVKLSCLMRASSMTEFMRNWKAFRHDLTSDGEHSFYFSGTGRDYPCYYKSCGVSEFITSGKIWFEFSVTLCFYNGIGLIDNE